MKTDYERFADSPERRRLLRREEVALEVTEAIAEALERSGMTRAELARRMGRTRGYITQILAGGRNLTLATLADVADALGCDIRVQLARAGQRARRTA